MTVWLLVNGVPSYLRPDISEKVGIQIWHVLFIAKHAKQLKNQMTSKEFLDIAYINSITSNLGGAYLFWSVYYKCMF